METYEIVLDLRSGNGMMSLDTIRIPVKHKLHADILLSHLNRGKRENVLANELYLDRPRLLVTRTVTEVIE